MSEVNKLPKGWCLTTIPALIAGGIFTDGDWVESKDQDPQGSVRLLQLADIGDGFFINKSNRFLNEEAAYYLNNLDNIARAVASDAPFSVLAKKMVKGYQDREWIEDLLECA